MKKVSDSIYIVAALLTLTIATACSNRTSNSRLDGEIIEDISELIKSFDTDATPIGAWGDIKSEGKWIFINNPQSIDTIVSVFDAKSLRWEGNIAKSGPGPDEIISPGTVVYDNERDDMIIFDYGQLKVKAFNVDSALKQEYYSPHVIQHIPSGQFPSRYVRVNDSIGFARMITLPKNPKKNRGYTQSLCRYNLSTGEMKEFSTADRQEGLMTLFGINPELKLLVECAINNDLLTIYDFDGNKLKEIPGPEYNNDEIDKQKIYFRQVVVTQDNILALYSGSDDRKINAYGRYIQVYDIDGNYIKTLDSGKLISSMDYDKNTGRLLMRFNDPDIQLGYVDLNKVLN